jgi:purine-nucleoside/S-methyl-5'-thioadenosine phosphorylase / adenosine deaminase
MPNHGVTSTLFSSNRHDGVSHGPYQSLNLSYGVGDTRNAVTENRNRLKSRHSINFLLSARQIHGDSIYIARNPLQEDMEVDEYDALMTDIPGIGLMIQQADCQAVTLFDPSHSVIAAIHCGWKGSVLNILAKTVLAMKKHYDSSPADIHATISPSLGPCCAEFINHKQELPPSFLAFQVKENYFDFWQISKMQLIEAGLKEQNVRIAGQCTSCSPDYFSYRRACRESDGRTGRCATMIALQ